MPNHVRTVVKISKLKKDDIDFILNTIASPLFDDTEGIREELWKDKYRIDFNKIIPEPETEDECPDEYKVNKDSHISIREEKPWFDWYEWHIANWGTKWGAYDCYTKIGKSYIKFIFSTAWNVAQPIIERLSLLGFPLEVKYADEDWGSNCGVVTWSREQGWESYNESSYMMKNPERFARELWNRY